MLDIVGLASAARRRAGTFSLGMKQRLGVAAALLGDPPILILDEPTIGLDPEGIQWMRETLRALAAEGRTVFVSSHLMSELEDTADQLIVIGKGTAARRRLGRRAHRQRVGRPGGDQDTRRRPPP